MDETGKSANLDSNFGPFDESGYPILTEVNKDSFIWGRYRFVRNRYGKFDEYCNGELIIGGSVGYPDKASIEQRFHDFYAMLKRHGQW